MAYSSVSYSPNDSVHSRSTTDSQSTSASYDTMDTAPTSTSSSGSRPHVKTAVSCGPRFILGAPADESVGPATLCIERASIYSYASSESGDEDEDEGMDEGDDDSEQDGRSSSATTGKSIDFEDIPELPTFYRDPRSVVDSCPSRPANPNEFAQLFPSMNRLSIRHDDRTSDGTHNLRIETTVNMPYSSSTSPSSRSARHRQHGPVTMQLFHLRMYDLARREFSLRRYARDSGREVCNSKRKLSHEGPSKLLDADKSRHQHRASSQDAASPGGAATARPSLSRSMSTAFQKLGAAARPAFRRSASGSPTGGATTSRPSTRDSAASSGADDHSKKATNTLKLEFSNYARVDVTRRGRGGKKRYEFSWWGYDYRWERAVDKHTGGVSFHLVRTPSPMAGAGKRRGSAASASSANDAAVFDDDTGDERQQRKSADNESRTSRRMARRGSQQSTATVASTNTAADAAAARTVVAHIVPEQRSPTQVAADARAGAWIPPCYMWIADASVLEVLTDVGDVIVATGVMSLVDDAIKERWGAKAVARRRKAEAASSIPLGGSRTLSSLGGLLRRGYSDARMLPRPAPMLGRMVSVH